METMVIGGGLSHTAKGYQNRLGTMCGTVDGFTKGLYM